MTATSEGLKVFLMTAQLLEEDLDAVEQELALDLGRKRATSTGEAADYYPQIEHAFRAEAKEMAPHYEVFYSLERTIRTLVADSLEASDGAAWWSDPNRVPQKIKDDCESRLKKEEIRASRSALRIRSTFQPSASWVRSSRAIGTCSEPFSRARRRSHGSWRT